MRVITSNLENEHLLVFCQKCHFLMDCVLNRIPVHPYDLITDLKVKRQSETKSRIHG